MAVGRVEGGPEGVERRGDVRIRTCVSVGGEVRSLVSLSARRVRGEVDGWCL